MKKKNPFKHWLTLATQDGHTATIDREKTPMRLCDYRYRITITRKGDGKQLAVIYRFSEDSATTDALNWKWHGTGPLPGIQ